MCVCVCVCVLSAKRTHIHRVEEEERRQTDRQTSGPDRDYVMWPRYSLTARTRLFAPTADNYSCAGVDDDDGKRWWQGRVLSSWKKRAGCGAVEEGLFTSHCHSSSGTRSLSLAHTEQLLAILFCYYYLLLFSVAKD